MKTLNLRLLRRGRHADQGFLDALVDVLFVPLLVLLTVVVIADVGSHVGFY
jgi:hypothetical protein